MNLFKKTTATLALVALLSGIFSTGVSAASTAEIEAANFLAKAGIIVDHQDNPDAYSLDQNVLRQEIAAVARWIANLEKKTTCDGTFKDVSATKPNDWACYTIEQLSDNGLIALNENFRPEDNISKAEGIGMIVKAAFGDKYEYDATLETTWQEQVVAFAVSEGVTSNFTNYDTPATRGFVFAAWSNAMQSNPDNGEDIKKIMCELLGICDEEGEDKEGEDKDPTTPVVKGSFEITLNPKTPAAQTIPKSGLVPFGKFDISAGKEDVKIESVKLTREGLSERTDIRRVYFEKDGIRVSNRSSVGIDEDAVVTFTPALTVRAGSTETLDLIVEMKSTGGGAAVGAEHRFAIKSESDVDASTTVGGTYPLRTALMRVGSYKVEEVEVTPVSSNATHNVGAEKALLTEFQLTTNGERDNLFKSITMRNAGTADAGASLTNIELHRDGKKVSSEVVVTGRDITIYVNDTIKNGRSENYQVRADITGAERTDETYQLEIRNESDLTVVEENTGFSAPVNLGGTVAKPWGVVTVEWGDFLVSRDTAYTLNQTVSSSTNDVVLYAAKINVKEEVSIEDAEVTMFITDKAEEKLNLENFSSLRLLVGGATVATYTPNDEDKTKTKVTFKFESNFNVRAGQSTMQITWNLKSNVAKDSKFTIETVDLWGTVKKEIRYVSNDEKVTVNGTAKGIATTVADGDLNLTRNDGIDNNNIVPGSTDKLVLGFSARANDVSDVKITGMNFEIVKVESSATSSGSIDIKDISNVRLYKDGKLVQNGTRNNFDFNSLDITLAKNTSSNFELLVDFSNSIKKGKEFQVVLNGKWINARNVSSNKQIKFESTTSVVKSREFKFTDGGELRLTKNSSQIQTSILTPSSSETSVFKFDLRADDDDIMVTDIYVTNTLPKGDDDADKAHLNLNDSLRGSSLYIGGKTYNGSIIGTNKIHFAIGANGLVVKRDQIVTWDVRIALHDSSKRSNVKLQLAIQEAATGDNTEVSGTVKGIKAISDSTGEELTTIAWDDKVESNTHLVARSKPTVAMSNFNASSTDLYKFTVTADSNRKIILNEVDLKLSGTAKLTKGKITIYRDSQNANNAVFYKMLEGIAIPGSDAAMTKTNATLTGTGRTATITVTGANIVAGDEFKVVFADTAAAFTGGTATYTAVADDTNETVATKLAEQIKAIAGSIEDATAATGVITVKIKDGPDLVLDNQPVVTVVQTPAATWTKDWVDAGKASKEIAEGQTVTFYVALDDAEWYKADERREAQIVGIKYTDEVDAGFEAEINATDYNVWVPTTSSSYQY